MPDLFRVLAWTGGAVEQLIEGTREEANNVFLASPMPAALCEGNDVLKTNARGKARLTAFEDFRASAKPVAAKKKPKALPRQTPTEPMPEREPARMSVTIEHASISIEVDELESTPAPVATKAAPTISPVRESPAPVTSPTDKPVCSNCHLHPRAGRTRLTRSDEVEWCTPCRNRTATKRAPSKVKRTETRAANAAAKKAVATPARDAAMPEAIELNGVLSVAQKNASLIERLGGFELASALADVVERVTRAGSR